MVFFAGEILSADDLNALVADEITAWRPMYFVKPSTESVTSSAVLQNDDFFAAISFPANQTWECELLLDVMGDTAGDIQTTWNTAGGATQSRRWVYGQSVSATTPDDGTMNIACRANTGTVNYGTNTSGTFHTGITEKFTVTTVLTGTITLQWAQRVSSGTATQVLAGSKLICRRLL